MHYCYVCGEVGKGVFRFPRDQRKLCLWLQSLGITGQVPDQARICPGHFLPSDILTNSNQLFVKDGAVPTKNLRTEAPSMEHNYACNSRIDDTIAFPWQLFLFTVIGLYLLFDYLLHSSHAVPGSSTTNNSKTGGK